MLWNKTRGGKDNVWLNIKVQLSSHFLLFAILGKAKLVNIIVKSNKGIILKVKKDQQPTLNLYVAFFLFCAPGYESF